MLLLLLAGPVAAQSAESGPGPGLGGEPGATTLDLLQVTATRFREPVQEVPESIEILTAADLAARGVRDLRGALALLGGVTVAPGGDEGPGSAVPGLLGLREADDFLLLVDGVPAGGVFVPQFSTLDLNGIERIEVQRGPASVFYGTTAFAGTINLVHYAAGTAARTVSASYGSYGSAELAASAVPGSGALDQSLVADAQRDRYSDAREGRDRAHLLYRLGSRLAGGRAHLDLDATVQHEQPTSPRPFVDGEPAAGLPVDFNQNPADGKIDSNRFRLLAGYERATGLGSWGTTVSATQTHLQQVRGFLVEGAQPGAGASLAANGFHQRRELGELFVDTHLTGRITNDLAYTVGVNELYGLVHQDSEQFSYALPADGSLPPASAQAAPGDRLTLSDTRSFSGLYAQTRWTLTPRLGLLAGLRLNHTEERRTASDPDDSATQRARTTRLSGSAGVNWRVWQDAEADLDDVVIYGNYGNTFQPPQIDFAPEGQGRPLLRPETAQSLQFGIKADGDDGRLSADLAAFLVNFRNQPVIAERNGLATLVNGGRQRYLGVELELAYQILPFLAVNANASYSDARYRDFETEVEGRPVQLRGERVPLTAAVLAAAGLRLGRRTGWGGSLSANFVGPRTLRVGDEEKAEAYARIDASLAYRFARFSIALEGDNLGDRRAPTVASELGEGQVYVLPGRRVFLRLGYSLP
ncbi:MAG: hypothetical protein NVS9B10_21070 [Nevskia sp.]